MKDDVEAIIAEARERQRKQAERTTRKKAAKAAKSRAARAQRRTANPSDNGVQLDDFYAYMPEHKYIFAPTGEIWPASSVDARLPDVGEHQGEHVARPEPRRRADDVGTGRADRDRGPPDRRGRLDRPHRAAACSTSTARRSSSRSAGNADPLARPRRALYGADARPHRATGAPTACSGPHEKINHALVLGGKQGIGKDTLLEPVKHAVGPWNFARGVAAAGARPLQRLPEVRDPARERGARPRRLRPLRLLRPHEELSPPRRPTCCASMRRTSASTPSRTSAASSSPPTTRPTASICPPTTAAISSPGPTSTRPTSPTAYWNELWDWYDNGGCRGRRPLPRNLDLSGFNPKAPPPKTEAFWEIVNASRSPEDAELADALDVIGWPDAVTIATIINGGHAVRLRRLAEGPQEQPQDPAPL